MTFSANDKILPPKLENALGSLGTTLEAELARYRQQREGGAPSSNAEPEFDPAAWPDHEDYLGDANLYLASEQPAADQHSPAEALTLTHVDIGSNSDPNSDPKPHPLPNHLEAELDEIADDQFQALTRSLIQPDLNPHDLNPKDYLESSEALLKNVGTARAEQPQSATVNRGWMLAAGLGLALSLAGAYLILNPELWQRFRAEPVAVNLSPAAPSLPSPTTATLPGPSLDQKEFKELNIGNLSQAQPSPAATTAASAGSSASPAALPSPQAAAPTASPAPRPTAAQAAGSDNFFYVVTEYSGEPAFKKAQQALPNAYLVNFKEGTRIQFGAFVDLESAQALVQSLKSRGIEATVRQPRSQN
ncbi:MAG: SPOR domain-containing protein [Aphanocapsa sp. GSE-SYN-MK-11-07L]|jgi:cell division septation protein DedD|nr:SPOR domain-containing protein [Aphanocapsa sp. GSE-SYN-MK-11-07L]